MGQMNIFFFFFFFNFYLPKMEWAKLKLNILGSVHFLIVNDWKFSKKKKKKKKKNGGKTIFSI